MDSRDSDSREDYTDEDDRRDTVKKDKNGIRQSISGALDPCQYALYFRRLLMINMHVVASSESR